MIGAGQRSMPVVAMAASRSKGSALKNWSDVLRCTEMYSEVVGGKAPVGDLVTG